jgi:hypothetical protein
MTYWTYSLSVAMASRKHNFSNRLARCQVSKSFNDLVKPKGPADDWLDMALL